MKHAFIAPHNYLHLIPQDSNFHLLLAHLLRDERYVSFYKERQQKGDFIIIDNGAFEFKKPLNPKEYVELVAASGIIPDIVVAPDYPFKDYRYTIEDSLKFVREYGNYFDTEKTKVMCVPQSERGDKNGWIEAYTEMSTWENVEFIGMSILGIPNAFCTFTGTDDISFNRTFATALLQSTGKLNHYVKHHYLGCSDPREILMMIAQGVAYSNDSSTAIWHGINGIMFDETASGLIHGKIKREVDFDLPYNSETDGYIVYNIRVIENWILSQKHF